MNRIAANAANANTTNPIHRNASSTYCGIASNHFDSHNHREGSSRCPSTRTGYDLTGESVASMAPTLPPTTTLVIRANPQLDSRPARTPPRVAT